MLKTPTIIETEVSQAVDKLTFEQLCDMGSEVREKGDLAAWTLGDIALRVETYYSLNSIAEWANAVGIEQKQAYHYRSMSKYYPEDSRGKFEHLTRSHYKIAKRLKDFNASMAILSQANRLGWSCAQLERQIATADDPDDPDTEEGGDEPEKLLNKVAGQITGVDADDPRIAEIKIRIPTAHAERLIDRLFDNVLITVVEID